MPTYYIGADVHSNNTELAIEKRGNIVPRYSMPTTIPAISTILNSLQGKKVFAMEKGPMAGYIATSTKRLRNPLSTIIGQRIIYYSSVP